MVSVFQHCSINVRLGLQEILYPEFCSILVRFACARYSMLPGLANRMKKLVVDKLLPLLERHMETPMLNYAKA